MILNRNKFDAFLYLVTLVLENLIHFVKLDLSNIYIIACP
jgi:hypothetical protein